jgi:hypothetical protein
MDRNQLDTLARSIAAKQSRRAAVATLLGATLLGRTPDAAARNTRRSRVRAQAKAKAKPCYPGTSCTPGKGKNTSGCDFSNSTSFIEKDVRGSNLSNANFTNADAWGADFRGANLSGACFVDATLFGAKLGASVNLGGAIFCRTMMPDGSVDNSGCDKATACCPTTTPPPSGTCDGVFNFCNVLAPNCCDGLVCTPTFGLAVSSCEKVCSSDAECKPFGSRLVCRENRVVCPFFTKCCVLP